MLEILQFVFSSFWTWLGTFLLVTIVSAGFAGFRFIEINRSKD